MTKVQAQCNTAVGLLEGALAIVARANNEAPKRPHYLGPEFADINRRISALQQKLLAIHDGKSPS
jgi:hypothetical protein